MQSLLAYALLPAGRGAYAVCIMFSALLGILFTPGSNTGAQYFLMVRKISVSQGFTVSLVICLLGTVLATALAIPLIHSNIAFFRKAEPNSFYLALMMVPLNTFSSALQHQLAGLGRFARLALYSLFQSVANGLAAVSLVLALRLAVDGALLAVSVGELVMITFCLRDLRRSAGLSWSTPSRLILIDVVWYGLKYQAARVASNFDARIGILILGMLSGRSEIGIFAVASGLMIRLIMISDSVASPLLPRSARHGTGHPDLVAFCARVTTWVTGLALVALLAFSVPIVRILLPADFLPIVPLLRIIVPGILVFAGANVLTSFFRGMNRPDVCSWAAAIGLVTNVATLLFLYPIVGPPAAAWGMTAGLFARSLWLSVAYHRATSTSPMLNWLLQPGDLARIKSATQRVIRRDTAATIH